MKTGIRYIVDVSAILVILLVLVIWVVKLEKDKVTIRATYEKKLSAYKLQAGENLARQNKDKELKAICDMVKYRPAPIGCLWGIRVQENGFPLTYGVIRIKYGILPGEDEQLVSAILIIQEEMTKFVSKPEFRNKFMAQLADRWSAGAGAHPAEALWEGNVKKIWHAYDIEHTPTRGTK